MFPKLTWVSTQFQLTVGVFNDQMGTFILVVGRHESLEGSGDFRILII